MNDGSNPTDEMQLSAPSKEDAGNDQQLRVTGLRARQKLERDLISFLADMKHGGDLSLGRIPNSEDLLPLFEEYAQTLLDARLQLHVSSAKSIPEGKTAIKRTIRDVVKSICKKKGIWSKAVGLACVAVNLGIWEIPPYGTYDQSAFARPPRRQLTARMVMHARKWESILWSNSGRMKAIDPIVSDGKISDADIIGLPVGEPNHPPIIGPYRVRAKWLGDELDNRGWGPQRLENEGGPTRNTTRRILTGLRVRPSSIETLAHALSKSGDKKVTPADVPNA